jgi:hypothetical protein
MWPLKGGTAQGEVMGFIAEEIQDKDRNLVDFRSLYNPAPNGRATFDPQGWCIDRERNAIFLFVPRIGRYGPDTPNKYALILAGKLIWVELFSETELSVPRKVTWKLASLRAVPGVTLSKDEILSLVREALEAYTLKWKTAPWLGHEHIEIEYRF